ncbi:MAG: sulfatase-like hydrolase/transferase [Alphaproteobacteria bacterium]|nr:sulfatase-like hydrolase/transferase [Alphaproteobacteria bacterium]
MPRAPGLAALLLACHPPDPDPLGAGVRADVDPGVAGVWNDAAPPDGGPNVLLVLLDDIGVDQVEAWGLGADPAQTPVLDALAQEGVRFTQAYAQPVCSPTRAAVLTGRSPHQTGIGSQVVYQEQGWSLSPEETTLAEALRTRGYASTAVGKWHLDRRDAAGPDAPRTVGGFDRFTGFDDNLLSDGSDGLPVSYASWEETVDGVHGRVDHYNTTHLVDRALEAVDAMPEPWFLYLAPAAAHRPFHVPPPQLHAVDPGDDGWRLAEMYDAMIGSVDAELGRLLSTLDPEVLARTWVIVMADNGTPALLVQPPFPEDAGKGGVREGGVRVPLWMAGPGIEDPGRAVDHLVQATDLFATVLDLARHPDAHALADDGTSLSLRPVLEDADAGPVRTWVAAERFEPLGLSGPYDLREQMVRRADGLKLLRALDGSESLYDLAADPFEAVDLLDGGELDPEVEVELAALRALADEVFGGGVRGGRSRAP